MAVLTLNRPDKLNALTYAMNDRLMAPLDRIEADVSLRAVILTGAGERAFSAGGDIPEFATSIGAGAEAAVRDFVRRRQAMTARLEAFPKPVIAAVNGIAFGGGCEITEAAHLDGVGYRSLTLVDPVALAPWESPFVRHVAGHAEAFAGLPAYLHEALLRAYNAGAAHRPMREDDLSLYLAPWLGETGQGAFYRQIAQMDQAHTDAVEPRYRQVRCPVQILWGREDSWIPLERGQELARRIPGARLRIVPDAGHLVQEDAPEAIVAALAEFLAEPR